MWCIFIDRGVKGNTVFA